MPVQPAVAARQREELLEHLHNLRTIVPVFAEELAGARRQLATLRIENRRLAERVRELQGGRKARKSMLRTTINGG